MISLESFALTGSSPLLWSVSGGISEGLTGGPGWAIALCWSSLLSLSQPSPAAPQGSVSVHPH